jgi:predicted alpha/beta superfamily hydrolase
MQKRDSSFVAHSIQEHLIRSSIVSQVFRIKVLNPIRSVLEVERFPVVYATDSDDYFAGYAALAHHLQLHGETDRFILVGIGYEEARRAPILRMRDYLTHANRALYESEIKQLAESPIVGGVEDLEALTRATDAAEFLRFIHVELMPFISRQYPVDHGNDHYVGYSAGGAFGIFTLFTRPATFKTYILGSPATSHNGNNYAVQAAKAFMESSGSMDARVFLSVGELEECKRGLLAFDLVSGFCLFAKFLRQVNIPGLELTTRMFPGETHATAWALAFCHGVRTLFGPADNAPFLPDYLR